jgi:hypothetical protein
MSYFPREEKATPTMTAIVIVWFPVVFWSLVYYMASHH